MNATTSVVMETTFDTAMVQVWAFLVSTRVELLLFAAAMVAYFALFSNAVPRNPKLASKKARMREDDDEYEANGVNSKFDSDDIEHMEKSFQASFDHGNHREVLRVWHAMKKFDKMPDVSLPQVVESMQRFKKDNSFIIKELRAFFKKYPTERDMTCMNDLLDSLAKRLDSDLMDKIVEMLPSLDLKADQRTYEIFLGMHFTTRSFQEVKALVADMKANKIPFTTRATIVVIKTALKMNNFEEAVANFRELKSVWTAHSVLSTPSMAPRHIVAQLVELACKEHQLAEFLPELRNVPITEEVVSVMLTECIRQKDLSLTQKVQDLASEQKITFSDSMYALLIKGSGNDTARVQALFDEVVAKKVEVTADFALAVINFCAQTSSIQMADRLYEHMKPKQLSVLSSFIRFYADHEEFEKACDVYEKDLLQIQGSENSHRSLPLDARMERSLMNAALRCGRAHLAKKLLDSAPSDVAKHITMMRNCAAEGNLQGAKSVFDTLKSSGVDLNSVIYNTMLDACVECRDLKAAEAWMEQTKQAGMADVVSFNTLIKAHLMYENFDKARSVMEEMKKEGLQPNRVTFNELINAMVTKGGQARRRQTWDIISEMKAAGVKPNQVTCSILLKSLNANSDQTDILMTMELINTMEEPMDEVLLSSVVEACVRIGKPDLLATKLKQLQGNSAVAVNGSHTFGSLIKAYGHAKDMAGVWRCWKEMRSRHIKPTSITLGCMVEAVVSNGDTEGAYELIHQMQDDEQCRSALNSVIYCSVLKGFTREKKLDRVWAVYEEMIQKGVEMSIVTYNTLIDACARCGRMEQVPDIMANLQKHGVRPNVITFSTTLKGHCQAGDIQRGFAILEQMKRETKLKPDEIMYNSLLDGCAQSNLIEEGLRILEEMQKEGVAPSNFTLSVLVKLMSRARKLNNAFTMVNEISRKHKFKPNVHVYTNLIQACITNRQLPKGVHTLETMIKENIQPDKRTYALLVRASIAQNNFEQAVGLLRGALGLPKALPFLSDSRVAMCLSLDYDLVNETLTSLVDRGNCQEAAVALMADIKQLRPKVRIDLATQRRVMSGNPGEQASSPFGRNAGGGGKGKGRGQRGPR
mmetsp:Transcript_96432/g.176589  ORF Transcript_96432/g.176589 Transcript_96432/m.176589 type:complete len:1096 (+) Transcript_96432:146-3433(+)